MMEFMTLHSSAVRMYKVVQLTIVFEKILIQIYFFIYVTIDQYDARKWAGA